MLDPSNPWYKNKRIGSKWEPTKADILFLAGLDWDALVANDHFKKKIQATPIINLIQGLTHADPTDHKYRFLSEPAVRICVSSEVARALENTHKVNGPIFTIPNGIDLISLTTEANSFKSNDFLIVAIKNQQMGLFIKQKLEKMSNSVVLIDKRILRQDFLKLVATASIVICLPLAREGFYLPALEAMALGCLVICPDCVGNKSFCKDGETCLVPNYDISSIVQAAIDLKMLDRTAKQEILNRASQKVLEHDLVKEREQFIKILKNINNFYPN